MKAWGMRSNIELLLHGLPERRVSERFRRPQQRSSSLASVSVDTRGLMTWRSVL